MELAIRRRNHLTDNDKHFGPVTIGEKSTTWKPIGIVLDSGDNEDNWGCSLNLYLRGRTVRINLPQIIKPWRQWIDTSKYSWSTNPKGGYWDVHAREYGFRSSDGFFQLFFGPQTDDSTTTKSWSCHLPWTEWRFVRHSLYGLEGEHLRTDWTSSSREIRSLQYDTRREFVGVMPKRRFQFIDYDGEQIEVTTYIEEREWHFGTGLFRWLSWFRKPQIRRSLDLEFNKETGPRKGSWKGGTMGHSIDMRDGELHEAAFRRYCDAHNMKFLKEID